MGGLGPRESWVVWAALPALLAAVVVGASLVLWSGDEAAGHPDVDLPVVEAADSMGALERGRVLLEERCALLELDREAGAVHRVLLLWPVGSEVVDGDDGLAVRLPQGGEIPLDGATHEVPGGYVNETGPLPDRLREVEHLVPCAERLDVTDVFQVALDV